MWSRGFLATPRVRAGPWQRLEHPAVLKKENESPLCVCVCVCVCVCLACKALHHHCRPATSCVPRESH